MFREVRFAASRERLGKRARALHERKGVAVLDSAAILERAWSSLRAKLKPVVIARAQAYVREGRVRNIVFGADGHTVRSRVVGSGPLPYQVEIYITRSRSGSTLAAGFCTCPMSADCKHVVATMLAALDASRLSASPAPVRLPDDPHVDVWLQRLRESIAEVEAASSPGDEQIAYVFDGKARSSRGLPIGMFVVRLSKTQRWTKVRETTCEALANGTARAVRATDGIVGRLLRVLQDTYRERSTLADEIVRRIVATGRAHADNLESPALSLGPPRTVRVTWKLETDGSQKPHLEFDDAELRKLPGDIPWYVDARNAVAGVLDAGMPQAALARLLEAPALTSTQAVRVRKALSENTSGFELPLPREVTERTVRKKPVPQLQLRTIERAHTAAINIAEYTLSYAGETIDPTTNAAEVRVVDGSEATRYPRSPKHEKKASERLQALGFVNDAELRSQVSSNGMFLRCEGDAAAFWPIFMHRDVPQLRAEGWQIEVDPSLEAPLVDLSEDALWHPTIAERSDGWFDLALGIDLDGKRYDFLPMLADLLSRREALADPNALEGLAQGAFYYVHVAGLGTTLALPAERLKAMIATLVELNDPGSLHDGALRVPRARAALVGELEAAVGLRWDVPDRIRELGERLRDFTGVTRIAVPKQFRGKLRDYQRDGLDWLQFLAAFGFGGVLADDMGLGKSVQTLAHLLCEKQAGRLERPALLVVPTSLVHNWCDEAARFAPSLRVLPLQGPTRAARFDEIADADLVITTYALLPRDTTLAERTWHSLILDEAQAVKNPQSKAAQAAMGMRTGHRLCLTGTPVENNLGDLWSLFSIALPGALGDRKQFGRLFRTPIEKHADGPRGRLLAERIRPFLLRRTKEAVASELPEKTEIVKRVELVGSQRDLYETIRLTMHERVRAEIAERGLARSQIVILDALLKLRQVCCDPRLLPERLRKSTESIKLDLLKETLPQMVAEGRHVLIFSQFTSMLDIIAPALDELGIGYVVLTGKTKDRARVVKSFQAGEVPVFLISLKAGGTGLNLTAADTVIHYDPWWNPAVERQATDRAHRIGQTQRVFVYKFIGAGTVEEKIVALQSRKASLAAAIFSQDGASAARFEAADIERLFAPIE